jgi:hypothetical protein
MKVEATRGETYCAKRCNNTESCYLKRFLLSINEPHNFAKKTGFIYVTMEDFGVPFG